MVVSLSNDYCLTFIVYDFSAVLDIQHSSSRLHYPLPAKVVALTVLVYSFTVIVFDVCCGIKLNGYRHSVCKTTFIAVQQVVEIEIGAIALDGRLAY